MKRLIFLRIIFEVYTYIFQYKGKGFEYIIYLLQNSTSLKYLNVSECNLETIEAFSLGDGLNKNLSLTHLDISGNPILIKGAYAIADGIAAHKSLNILNLSRYHNCLQNR